MLHVILGKEGEFQTSLYLLLQEIENQTHEWLWKIGLFVDDSSNDLLERTKRTVQDKFINNFMIFGCEHDCSYSSHTPSPNSQFLNLKILVGFPQDCLSICRLVDAVSQVPSIAVATANEIKRDYCHIVLSDQGQYAHYFNFTPSVAMEIEQGIVRCLVFLSEDYCADITSIIPWDGKIDTLNKMIIDKLLTRADSVNVVCVLVGSNYSLPSLFKGFPQLFHQQEIMIKCIAYNNFITIFIFDLAFLSFTVPILQCYSLQPEGVNLSWQYSKRRNYTIQYSIMTQVILAEQQIELVNIVDIVQSKLTKNFTLILKRLNQHDALLTKYQSQMCQQRSNRIASMASIEQTMRSNNQLFNECLQALKSKVERLEENSLILKKQEQESQLSIRRVSDELFNTQLQFQQKIKQKQSQLSVITSHVQLLALEQNRLNEEMNKKENKVEAQRIVKQTEKLKDKNNHIESELKIAYHKIQKMEILNQKAERMQAKKEVEIFKEIQERVRKEIKNNFSGPVSQNGQNIPPSISNIGSNTPKLSSFAPNAINPLANLNQRKLESQQFRQKQIESKRGSIVIMDESVSAQVNLRGSDFVRGNMDTYLQKWGEKMRYFQVSLREVTENLKVLNKNSSKKESRQNKENNQSSQGIKDKINEIKPQIVKLWAKLDTIEDRLSFNERKLQQKLKTVSELANIIKENSASKLEEKLKNLQTEVFTNIKEIKGKLQTKINQVDYDKYCQKMEERIVQINELIYLKSDKLQVKKALLFLESKIKQIILVISQDQQNQKDALLTKKQLKCISCDKELDKFSGVISSPKGNWDGLPYKDHPPQILGRFGMTNFGSLSKKIKKLEGKDLPILNKRNANQSFQNNS